MTELMSTGERKGKKIGSPAFFADHRLNIPKRDKTFFIGTFRVRLHWDIFLSESAYFISKSLSQLCVVCVCVRACECEGECVFVSF